MSTLQINHVCLGGNLTREPALNRLPNGRIFVEFGISINDSYTTRDGQKIDRVCYVEIIAWGRLAEMVSAYVHKGGGVVVDGSLIFEHWIAKDGEIRSRLRVSASSIYFIGEQSTQTGEDAPNSRERENHLDESILAGGK